jgi:predicted MarR family transcription regulator
MSVILGILDEERERLKEAKKLYEARLKKLPKGSLRPRRRGKKVYIYRLFREGRHVCTRYVGVEGSAKVKELQKQLMERKQVQDFMRGIKTDLRILARVQRARKKG